MGMTGNYQDLNVLGLRSSGVPFLSHGDFTPVSDGAAFNLTSGDLPTIVVQLASATRNLSAEVYAASGSGLGRDWHKAFSFDYVPRNTSAGGVYVIPLDGTTFNGNKLNTLPAGKYVIVLTALQPLGDPSNPASVETWQSPVFEINWPSPVMKICAWSGPPLGGSEGWASAGALISALMKSIDNFSYVTSTLITPMFLVAGTFFPISKLPEWALVAANVNPLYHCVQLVRDVVFETWSAADLGHLAFLAGFALVSWRLAIRYMERKLIL